MTQEIIPVAPQSIGELANIHASKVAFSDYQMGLAKNTKRRHKAELSTFADFLQAAGLDVNGDSLMDDPTRWQLITHGLVTAFVRWLLAKGYAIGSVNLHLSTVKVYAGLAAKAEVLPENTYALIALVKGFTHKQGRNVDEERDTTRIGHKKAEALFLTEEQATQLKQQPDTPQGRRDAFLVCLLLDHGLRCSEVAGLLVEDVAGGYLNFYRKKVDLTQKHRLTPDTLQAYQRYIEAATPETYLLMGSRKDGTLLGRIQERSITRRVNVLCERVGVQGVSAHDGRHTWATLAVEGGTHVADLQDAGGWASPYMPLRYIKRGTVANEGVKLGKKG